MEDNKTEIIEVKLVFANGKMISGLLELQDIIINDFKKKLINEINHFSLGEYTNKHLKEVITNLK